jgi:hypothetical protein
MEIYTRDPFPGVQAVDPHIPINRTIRLLLDQIQKTDDEAIRGAYLDRRDNSLAISILMRGES